MPGPVKRSNTMRKMELIYLSGKYFITPAKDTKYNIKWGKEPVIFLVLR
jgi:TATA-box binding protein (TBP) (component of TFIID and TFIIIB)